MRLRIAFVVAIAGALLGVATGCGAKPAADQAGLLVYDVATWNGTAGAGLFVVDDDGRNRRRLTGPPPPSSASDAAWSPKGGTILFQSDLAAEEEFWTIEADGTDLRQVGRGQGATWSPDGREIAIVLGDDEISIVGRDGSPRRTIQLGLEKDEYPDVLAHWSPDGSRMALDVEQPDTTSHVAVWPRTERARPRCSATTNRECPKASPTGRRTGRASPSCAASRRTRTSPLRRGSCAPTEPAEG